MHHKDCVRQNCAATKRHKPIVARQELRSTKRHQYGTFESPQKCLLSLFFLSCSSRFFSPFYLIVPEIRMGHCINADSLPVVLQAPDQICVLGNTTKLRSTTESFDLLSPFYL